MVSDRYVRLGMEPHGLQERTRASAGLTQDELARRAGTSRPTLSAYENGRKSPTVATFARLLAEAGYELAAEPQVMFTRQPAARGRSVWVPDHLPRLDMAHAFAPVRLPLHLNWSTPGRVFDLGSRAAARARTRSCCRRAARPTSWPSWTARCSSTCGTIWYFRGRSGQRGLRSSIRLAGWRRRCGARTREMGRHART